MAERSGRQGLVRLFIGSWTNADAILVITKYLDPKSIVDESLFSGLNSFVFRISDLQLVVILTRFCSFVTKFNLIVDSTLEVSSIVIPQRMTL